MRGERVCIKRKLTFYGDSVSKRPQGQNSTSGLIYRFVLSCIQRSECMESSLPKKYWPHPAICRV